MENREQLISEYVDRILDNMSTKDLMRIVGDQLEENLSSYSDNQLSRLATEDNSPWHTTILNHSGRKNPNIDENLISSYFKSKMQ